MPPTASAPDDRAFADAQRFLLLAKRYWSTRLTADLRAGSLQDRSVCSLQPDSQCAGTRIRNRAP